MGYFNAITDYLEHGPEPDPRIGKFAKLLEIKDSVKEEDLSGIVNDPEFGPTLPKRTVQRFNSSRELEQRFKGGELNIGYSPALIKMAFDNSTREIVTLLKSINPEEYSKFLLNHLGYDIDSLQESQDTFWPELANWSLNRQRYVPFRDFYDRTFKREEEIDPTNYGTNRHLKDAIKGGLEGIAAMGEMAGSLVSNSIQQLLKRSAKGLRELYKKMTKRKTPHDKINDDFNKRRFPLDVGRPFHYLLDGLEGLKKMIEEMNTIAWVKQGESDFYLDHLITGFPDKRIDLKELEETGFVYKPTAVKVEKDKKYWDKLKLLYSEKFYPSSPENFLVPWEYGQTGSVGNLLTFHKGRWDLDKVEQRGMVSMNFPPELLEKIRGYREKEAPIQGIVSDLEKMFEYGFSFHNPLAARFENAATLRKGVCQDVNFLLWYTLRQLEIPSFMALGFVEKDRKISIRSGHAVVLAKQGEKWEMYDATPALEERVRLRRKQIRLENKLEQQKNHEEKTKDLSFWERMKDLRNDVRRKYRDAKALAYQKLVDAESFYYRNLLGELDKELFFADFYVNESIKRLRPGSFAHSKATARAARELESLDNVEGISLFKYDGPIPSVQRKVSKLFRPSKVRDTIKSLEYYQRAFPEYANRFGMFTVSEDVLARTLKTEGKIYPFDSSQNGQWTGLVKNLFALADIDEEPPSPLDVDAPERAYLKLVKYLSLNAGRDANGRFIEKIIYPPRELHDLRTDDPRVFFIANPSSNADLTNTRSLARIYGLPEDQRMWFHSAKEYPGFFPETRHYTLSPKVLAFDKAWSQRNRSYWEAVGNMIDGYIELNELSVPIVHDEIKDSLESLKSHYVSRESADFFADYSD